MLSSKRIFLERKLREEVNVDVVKCRTKVTNSCPFECVSHKSHVNAHTRVLIEVSSYFKVELSSSCTAVLVARLATHTHTHTRSSSIAMERDIQRE